MIPAFFRRNMGKFLKLAGGACGVLACALIALGESWDEN